LAGDGEYEGKRVGGLYGELTLNKIVRRIVEIVGGEENLFVSSFSLWIERGEE
jgi:hypothetical protein